MEMCDIGKLAELLNTKRKDDSDSEDELEEEEKPSEGPKPTDIGKKSNSVYTKLLTEEQEKPPDPSDPDYEDALYFPKNSELPPDWRKIPKWEVSYKQKVSASDVFLQRNGSTEVPTKFIIKEREKEAVCKYCLERQEISPHLNKYTIFEKAGYIFSMSGRNPSTASCEDMIIKICLPEEDRHNIDLKVTAYDIKLVSPKYRLEIPLPHPVDPKLGNAQWDNDAEKLIVTLRMNREFDFVNF